MVNEVWVPAQFLRQAFLKANVSDNKLIVMPEAIDTKLYDINVDPLGPEDLPKFNPDLFNFFSMVGNN